MEIEKSNRNKWKEEMLDGIRKHGFYGLIFRGSNVFGGEGFGDCDNDVCDNEKDQKNTNVSFHSENQIVGVVINFPELCSIKLRILDDKKSGS
jgi:hypothetical protein